MLGARPGWRSRFPLPLSSICHGQSLLRVIMGLADQVTLPASAIHHSWTQKMGTGCALEMQATHHPKGQQRAGHSTLLTSSRQPCAP